MKSIKQLFVSALALTCAFSLAACLVRARPGAVHGRSNRLR